MPVASSSSQVHSSLPHELFTCSHPHPTDVTRPCKSDKIEQVEQQKCVSQLLDRNGRVHVLQLGHEDSLSWKFSKFDSIDSNQNLDAVSFESRSRKFTSAGIIDDD
jgi:hypothetical protein